jgi:hypothetical protein
MPSPDEPPLDRLSVEQRLARLERDDVDHARIIGEIVDKTSRGFSDAQIDQIRAAFREELAAAGLRIDEPKDQDQAREDFRFLRRLRLIWDAAVSKVGSAVLTAIVGVLFIIIGAGFWAWLSSNLHK